MMEKQIKGLRVAIVVTDGFEQDELIKPRKALEEAGAETEVVAPNRKRLEVGKMIEDFGELTRRATAHPR